MVAGAKVLAASILDLLTKPGILQRSRMEFDAQPKQTPYFPVPPPDAKPPRDLDKAAMDRTRPQMRKLYLGKQPWLLGTSMARP
jgi:hypothetical protein